MKKYKYNISKNIIAYKQANKYFLIHLKMLGFSKFFDLINKLSLNK